VGIIKTIYLVIRAFLLSRLSLAPESLALRQQVAVYEYTIKHPKMRTCDRVFGVWLSRLWSNWRSLLAIVQPETVIPREVGPASRGKVISISQVGGLHHRYTRAA
jgi:hypothetical protein